VGQGEHPGFRSGGRVQERSAGVHQGHPQADDQLQGFCLRQSQVREGGREGGRGGEKDRVALPRGLAAVISSARAAISISRKRDS